MNAKIVIPLLFAAALSGCVSQSTYKQEVAQVDTLTVQNQTYLALQKQLQAEIQADQVQIKQLQGRLTVTLVDEILVCLGQRRNARQRSRNARQDRRIAAAG